MDARRHSRQGRQVSVGGRYCQLQPRVVRRSRQQRYDLESSRRSPDPVDEGRDRGRRAEIPDGRPYACADLSESTEPAEVRGPEHWTDVLGESDYLRHRVGVLSAPRRLRGAHDGRTDQDGRILRRSVEAEAVTKTGNENESGTRQTKRRRKRMMTRIVLGVFLCTAVLSGQDPGSSSDAVYSAIRDNDLTRLQTMLKGAANPNASDPRGGGTPLMYAAVVGSLEGMTVLLDNGADVNAANSVGATALMWAANDLAKVKLLLARGANPKAVSQRGRTALFLAARSDRSADIVKLLIAAGADARAVDAAKMTVLHAAAAGNDTETIRQVIDAGGADVNAADFAGFTPLI